MMNFIKKKFIRSKYFGISLEILSAQAHITTASNKNSWGPYVAPVKSIIDLRSVTC